MKNQAPQEITADPLVSVIIPVYNVAPYLREALDSVINQTYQHLEILVIDDGSTDGSSQICDEYRFDPRIIVFHQENHGLSNARNNGLDVATGEYIAFLDSDDAWHQSFIEDLLATIERTNSDIAMCRYSVQKTDGRLISQEKKGERGLTKPRAQAGTYERENSLRMTIHGVLNWSVWNRLYRAELWKNIRFPEGHNFEDVDTIYHIIDICKTVTMIELVLYYHRFRPGSITQTMSWKNIDDRKRAFSRLEEYMRAHTPKIFSEGRVQKKIHSSGLIGMILCYIRFSFGGEVQREALRKEILATGQQIGVESCTIRCRGAFFIVKYCPWLLKTVCSAYRLFRILVHKMIGRKKWGK